MQSPMGNRVRVYIGIIVIALVAVNLLVFLYVGPSMSTLDDDYWEPLPKDEGNGGDGPSIPEDPIVIPDVPGPPPGDEPKG